MSKKIVSVSETIYGFSHYYTVFYEDGSWEHVFYYRAEFEPFIEEGKRNERRKVSNDREA